MKYPAHRNGPVSRLLLHAQLSLMTAAVCAVGLVMRWMTGSDLMTTISIVGGILCLANAAYHPVAAARFMRGTSEAELGDNEKQARSAARGIVLIMAIVSVVCLLIDVSTIRHQPKTGTPSVTGGAIPMAS